MQSKATYIDSLLTRRDMSRDMSIDDLLLTSEDESNTKLSVSVRENLELEAARVSHQIGMEQSEYLEFLELLFYASTEEQASSPESIWLENAKTHALKLLVAFGSVKEAVTYINRYEKVVKSSEGGTRQLIHDACLFSLPEILDEICNSWNIPVWQKILLSAKPNGPDDEIMRLLPFAEKITDYIESPLNKSALEQMVREEVENEFRKKYKIDFENIHKISFEQWLETELKNNPKLVLNSKLKLELQAIFRDETLYMQYRLEKERFLPSTIKSKMSTIIPFSAKTPLAYIKKIANTFLYKRAKENSEAAHLFFKYRIPEEKFNLYLSLKPDNSHEYIPDITIEGKNIHEKYKKFRLEKLNANDPKAAILGKFTSCCQSLGQEGEECAIHGITNKKGGFYVFCDEKNNIIAQCWVWYGQDGNIVFDSIEIAMNYNKHKTMIMDFYVELANHLVQQHNIPCIMVGTGGATPEEMKTLKPYNCSSPENYSGYRDSETQTLVASRAFPLLIETYKDINTTSLLADKPVNDMVLSQLREYYDLYCVNKKTPGPRIQDHFKSNAFTKEAQNQRSELINSWLKFLQDINYSYSSIKILPLQKIENFIKQSVNLNTRSNYGYSILPLASRNEPVETLKFLIANGASTNATALSEAVKSNNMEVVKFLLMQPIDINGRNQASGKTPLYTACVSGNYDLAKLLLEQKNININRLTEAWETAIEVAPSVEIINLLIEHGATPTTRTLNNAVANNNIPVIKLLLKYPAIDINQEDINGESVLSKACKNGSIDIAKLLLSQNGVMNTCKTLLHAACRFKCNSEKEKCVELVNFVLLQKNIDINAQDRYGNTALHIAISSGHGEDIIGILLQHGAGIQYKNERGETALDRACGEEEMGIDLGCSNINEGAIQQLLLHAKTHSLPMEPIMSPQTFNKIFPGSKTKEQKRETPKKIHRFFSESSSSSSSDSDFDDPLGLGR